MWSGVHNYKRHVSKNFLIFAFLFVLVIASIGLGAACASKLYLAPLNPAFVTYMYRVRAGAPFVQVSPEGYHLGYIPSPVDRSHLDQLPSQPLDQLPSQPPAERLGQPATYDLRTLGRVTPVRDQGSCGSCWAYGTMASLESSLLTAGAGTWDLSENNLKECHLFTWGPCDGGNADMSTAYFARGVGPLTEADDPYRDYVTGCSQGSPCKQVREVWYLPQSAVKDAIMTYGVLYTAFYVDGAYYDPTNATYYYTGSASTNHVVAIVGWDDNFDKNLFPGVTKPPANGAWILKNNWGTDFGIGGYFYMSYYDTHAADYPTLFFDARDPDHSTVYQYDPLGWVNSSGYTDSPTPTVAWATNVFTTTQPGYLDRVAFYTTDNNTSYDISIRSGGPDGADLATKSGSAAYSGYHTVDLTTPIWLAEATTFAVVIKFTNSTYNYPVVVEYAWPGYSDAATASPGQSYMSDDGTVGSWFDVTDWDSTANVCIQAILQGTASVFRVNDLGSVYSDSSFYGAGLATGSADVAEWVPVSEPVEPGDVLELDPENPGQYRKSRGPCSDLVAGVVSTQPGVVLGTDSSTLNRGLRTLDSALLALIGIVPVKVSDEGGPIEPGDLLTTSSTPGYATKWRPGMGEDCTFVGKALEPLESGAGIIEVLLMR